MKNKKNKDYTVMLIIVTMTIFVILMCLILLAVAVGQSITRSLGALRPILFVLILFAICLLIGVICGAILSRRIAKRQIEIENVINEVASGNFDVQIETNGDIIQPIFDDMNRMIRELKNNQILRQDFISNYAHEFKTPIVSINGFSELLLNEKLDKKTQREYLQIIYDESNRLAKLSNNMLYLSKLESQGIVLEQKEINLASEIDEVIKAYKIAAQEKELIVTTKLEDVKITGNAEMIRQVLINLFTNAVKYSNAKGEIIISLWQNENEVNISFQDNGIGMSEEAQAHIFEKFYQADKSHKASGSGLGLCIVKQIVELHKGKVSVESIEGKGSNFIVTLPK